MRKFIAIYLIVTFLVGVILATLIQEQRSSAKICILATAVQRYQGNDYPKSLVQFSLSIHYIIMSKTSWTFCNGSFNRISELIDDWWIYKLVSWIYKAI